MNFLNPLGFLMLIGIPIIYFISRKNKEKISYVVSSIEVWKRLDKISDKKSSKKISMSLLFIIEIIVILIGILGAIDIYFTNISKNQTVAVIMDSSFSMERVKNKEEIKDFFNGNSRKNFKIFFVDSSVNEMEGIYSSNEAKDIMMKDFYSDEPLDVSLLKQFANKEKKSFDNVIIFSDKDISELEGLIILGSDNNNRGIRGVNYNKKSHMLEILIENDYGEEYFVPLKVKNHGIEIFAENIFIGGNTVLKYNVDLINLTENEIITVEIKDNDSLKYDNKYQIPVIKNIDVVFNNNNYQMQRVFDLIPYAKLSTEGKENFKPANFVSSDIKYDDDFLHAVESGNLFTDEIMNSPYFPLWIEDHVNELYKKEIDEMNNFILRKNPYYSYIKNDEGENYVLENSQNKMKNLLSKGSLIFVFLIGVLLEEEVRRRV